MLDHHVHAALRRERLHFGGDVLRIVVDHVVGAQFPRFGHLRPTAGGGDDAAVKHLGDLDGGLPDAARGGEHQHVLAGLQLRARHQHVPRGEEDQRRGGGLLPIEVAGDLDGAVLRRGDELAIAAVDPVAEYGVAAAEIILPARHCGHWRQLTRARAPRAIPAARARKARPRPPLRPRYRAQDMRQGELHAGDAGAHEQVEVVERRRRAPAPGSGWP